MDLTKILIGTLIATLFVFATDFLFYGVLMADYFVNETHLKNPRFLWIVIATVVFGYAFCQIYVRGIEENKPPIAQGIRFGVLIALIVGVFWNLMMYATTNLLTMSHYITDIAYRIVQLTVLGIIIAKFFGPKGSRPGMSSGGDA